MDFTLSQTKYVGNQDVFFHALGFEIRNGLFPTPFHVERKTPIFAGVGMRLMAVNAVIIQYRYQKPVIITGFGRKCGVASANEGCSQGGNVGCRHGIYVGEKSFL